MAEPSRSSPTPVSLPRLAGLVCGAVVAWLTGPAETRADPADPFADLTPMACAHLAEARGGFRVAGVDVALGVSITDLVDGRPVAQTNLSLARDGRFVPITADQAGTLAAGQRLRLDGSGLAIDGAAPLSTDILAALAGPRRVGLPLASRILVNRQDNVALSRAVDLTLVMETQQGLARFDGAARSLADLALGAVPLSLP
ncbi:hypothetical protein CCR80_00680 [Rhodothalassium salexigens]|uniref:hypothetical protein n=1 Tax=Rhodothalassium salexigens TaxID=1086 RepID=UPI001914BFF2|nr:hypothetical protein [Rhodothalassium salexigens]MBK5919555.1 hypothetical protein [Rhodothalassium salexigens]